MSEVQIMAEPFSHVGLPPEEMPSTCSGTINSDQHLTGNFGHQIKRRRTKCAPGTQRCRWKPSALNFHFLSQKLPCFLLQGTIAMIYVGFIFIDTCAELLAARRKIIKNYCHFYHRFNWKASVVTSGCPEEPNWGSLVLRALFLWCLRFTIIVVSFSPF